MKLRDRSRESVAKAPLTNSLLRVAALAVATGGGVGFIPLAPGTFGSMVGVLLFLPLAREGLVVYFVAVALLAGVGVWSAGRAEEIFDSTDDGRIVIDEVVGQLIVLAPLVALLPEVVEVVGVVEVVVDGIAANAGDGVGGRLESVSFILLVVTGFVTFRVLDIYKPGVIRWVEQNISGGAGVMADDCVAGVLGAFALAIPTAGVLWCTGCVGFNWLGEA